MPTVGWILERDLEGFYEGTRGVYAPPQPIQVRFQCPFCASMFGGQRDQQDHIYDQHRVERPIVLLKGREPAGGDVVRRPLEKPDVVVVNASFVEVELDGRALPRMLPAELPDFLSSVENSEIKLTVTNNVGSNLVYAETSYRLSFRIVSVETFKKVERNFSKKLIRNNITRKNIDDFLIMDENQKGGSEYAAAIANYCMGILVKERPTGETLTTPISHYRELYGNAHQVLKDIDRPLARLITSVIGFAMNSFEAGALRTGYPELDLAIELLQNPTSANFPAVEDGASRSPICPIDHGTGRLLDLASRLHSQSRWGGILDDECRALSQSEVLDASDHQKAFAIWAASAWRLGEKQAALEPLRAIAAVYPFSRWASEYLEQVST